MTIGPSDAPVALLSEKDAEGGTSAKPRSIPVVGSRTTLRPEGSGDAAQLSRESTCVGLGVTLSRTQTLRLPHTTTGLGSWIIVHQYVLEEVLEGHVFVVYWQPGGVA